VKIGYLDLNYTSFYEDYSIAPRRYGGGRVFASWLKEYFGFKIFGRPETFDNISPHERREHCVGFTSHQMWALSHGHPLCEISPEFNDIDLFIYPHCNDYFNLAGLKAKQCAWSVGFQEPIHPAHQHLILYNDFQQPILTNPDVKIHKFTLGIELPKFQTYKKEDFIFQCSRHVPVFSSIEVAQFCQKNQIKGYFAGPIGPGYDLLSHIDNKYTFYLGEISDAVKNDYLSRARLCTLIQNWETPFSLSGVEALAYGTPIVCLPLGFWPTLIREGYNGFFAHNESQLFEAWVKAPFINQRDCYASVIQHNHFNMMHSLKNCFDQILK
jgi:glycosyltransferase involved in cell wall biosynthesis